MPSATVSAIGAGNGAHQPRHSGAPTTAAVPAVVVAPVIVKPAVNKALLYGGLALLLFMAYKNRRNA